MFALRPVLFLFGWEGLIFEPRMMEGIWVKFLDNFETANNLSKCLRANQNGPLCSINVQTKQTMTCSKSVIETIQKVWYIFKVNNNNKKNQNDVYDICRQ